MKKYVPDKPTTNSESPLHGDFESGVGFGLGSSATETVQNCNTFINQIFSHSSYPVGLAQWLARWTPNLRLGGSIPNQVLIFFFYFSEINYTHIFEFFRENLLNNTEKHKFTK